MVGVYVAMGEVRTGLLHHSTAVSPSTATHLLDLVLGQRVRRSDRPLPHAVSPPRITGVDCFLPGTGAKVRGVGSVLARAVLTGGHILQGSSYTRFTPGDGGRRLPWGHYLARPGIIEILNKVDLAGWPDGLLPADPGTGQLDLGAIADRLMDEVQRDPYLDHRIAFRTSRTQLRWVATDRPGAVTFSTTGPATRTLRLTDPGCDVESVAQLCEDVALHDWLLTTLLNLVERSRIGTGERSAVVSRLRPAVDYLLHLWMPGARVDQTLLPVWDGIERRPGFSRQWRVNVDRVRDQLVLGTMDSLGAQSLRS